MWDTDNPVKDLPARIRQAFVEEAKYLHDELEQNMLTVVLIPAPEPKHVNHMIRAAVSQNPYWYRELYHSNRHFRRDRSLRALDRIRKMQDRKFNIAPYKYDMMYRELIRERLVEGCFVEGIEVPSNMMVREYFGLERKVDED